METTKISPESTTDLLSEDELKKEIEDLKKKLEDLEKALAKKSTTRTAPPIVPPATEVTDAYAPETDYDAKDDTEKYTPTHPDHSIDEKSYSPDSSYAPDPAYTEEEYYTEDTAEIRDFRAEALTFINELSRRDQDRAVERFGGFRPFSALAGALRLCRLRNQAEALENVDAGLSAGPIGKTIGNIRGWFDRVGQRTISEDAELELDENLERAGVFNRNPWWKKCVKIGAKAIGGLGVAGAMVMTGGVGAATALLWSGGVKEAYDSVGQSIEQIGWGKRRSRAELESQADVSELVDHLKARVIDTEDPMTEEEYITLVENILARESDLMDRQCQNITSERKWQAGRSIASSVLTLGTGIFAGVPMGNINYDTDNTALAESIRTASGTPGAQVMNEAHKGFWNIMHGGQFGYGHENILSAVKDSINGTAPSGQEFDKMQSIINFLNNTIHGKFGTFSLVPTSVYGQAAHKLGQGLALADKLKLGSALLYLIAEPLRHVRGKGSEEIYTSYDPDDHSIYSESYSESEDGPEDSYSTASTEDAYKEPSSPESPEGKEILIVKEKEAIESYLKLLKKDIDAEKKYSKKPKSETEEYVKDLEEKSKDLPPMKPECKVAICVPAVYSEHSTIRGYLESLLGQEGQNSALLNPNSFEVNIFVNGPTSKVTEAEQTVSIIDEFKKEHPEMNINILRGAYEPRKNIGYYRKLVTDSALFRSRGRSAQDGPLYFVSHDADIHIMDKNYISNIIGRMDASPDTKVMAGRVDYSEEDKKKYPILWASRRMWQYLDMFRAEGRYGNIPEKAAGANTVIRAESYAKAKGYRIMNKVAEDLTLVENIIRNNPSLYHTKRNEMIKTLPNRVEISPRRDLNSIEKGKGLDSGYADFETNDSVRDNPLDSDQKVENIRPENEAEFVQQLEVEANAQMNSLFMKVFYDLCDHSPQMIEARTKGLRKGDPKLNAIQDKLYESSVGPEANARARDIFEKACGYLGIGDMDIQSRMVLSKKFGTKQNSYTVKIKDWSKLRDSFIEKAK